MVAKKTEAKTAPTKTGLAARAQRTDLAAVDGLLAASVSNIQKTLSEGTGGPRIIPRNGGFELGDGTTLGDSIQVVVVDYVSANKLYTGAYDPNNPVPPVCFSIGREIAEMVPSENSPEPQDEACAGCPMNQWNSAPNGKGKACKNTRELAVLLVDELNDDTKAPTLYRMSISPTGIKSFDGFVKQCARVLQMPPIAAIATLNAHIPPGTTYTAVTFADADNNEQYREHYVDYSDEAAEMLSVEPDVSNYQPTKAKPTPRGRR